MRHAIAFLFLVLAGVSARADKLHMKGGGELECDAVREGSSYRVRLPNGAEALIPVADVERLEPGETYRDEYIRRLNRLERTDAEGYYRLGLFCVDHGLTQEALYLFTRAVELEPDHEGARTALGLVRVDGEWVPREEAARRRGEVRYAGRWVSADEKDAREWRERVRRWRLEVRRLSARIRSPEAATREQAARDLGAIDDPAALEAVLEASEHWHPDVRAATTPALARFATGDGLPPAGGRHEEPQATTSWGEGAARRLARLAAHDDDLPVQDAAISAVGAAHVTATAEALLREYIDSEEAWVRNAAAHALGKIRYKPAFGPLVRTLYFSVLRNRLVPTNGLGPIMGGTSVNGPNGPADPYGRRYGIIRSYRLQRYEYRIVEDVAFNDAARGALRDLCGVDFDFDRTGWYRFWEANEARFDLWMRPAVNPR
jgi:hypothetical protein